MKNDDDFGWRTVSSSLYRNGAKIKTEVRNDEIRFTLRHYYDDPEPIELIIGRREALDMAHVLLAAERRASFNLEQEEGPRE